MIYLEPVQLPTLPKSNKGSFKKKKKKHNIIASLNGVHLQLTINLSQLIGERSKCLTLLKERMQHMGWMGKGNGKTFTEYRTLKWRNLPGEKQQEEDW